MDIRSIGDDGLDLRDFLFTTAAVLTNLLQALTSSKGAGFLRSVYLKIWAQASAEALL